MRQAADYFFDIPGIALKSVLEILSNIEFVTLNTEGSTLKSVIPHVPHFTTVYGALGEYIGTITLNEQEELAIAVLSELKTKPEKRDALINRIGVGTAAFKRIEAITGRGGLVIPKRARGQDILISPYYFNDSLDALANQAAVGGAKSIAHLLSLLKKAQGWPLSLIVARGEINGTKLTATELILLNELIADGVLKPPSLQNPTTNEFFVFTPKPGHNRLTGATREIYERTMAVVAAVRKGQLLPSKFAIRSPGAILNSLLINKRIKANSEAISQYTNLVTLRVGKLVQKSAGWYEFELIDAPENIQAIRDAIAIFDDGEPLTQGVNEEARIALQRDETYIQSLVSASKLKELARPEMDDQAKYEMEQILLL